MSNEIEVIFLSDVIAYPNGFTRCEFKSNRRYFIPKDFAEKQIEAGYCEAFMKRETKPAVIKKETKTKVKVKSEKQSKRSTIN